MKIDRIVVLNLDQCPERWTGIQAVFESRRVPPSVVHRQRAWSLLDFETKEDLNEASKEEGFWWMYSENINPHYESQKIFHYSQNKVLKDISLGNETVLFLEDDAILHQDWEVFAAYLDQIPDSYPVDILWVSAHYSDPNRGYNVEKEEVKEKLIETEVKGLYKNFGGFGTKARIFTPEGAARFLWELSPLSYDENFQGGGGPVTYWGRNWTAERNAEFIPWNIFYGYTPLDPEYCESFYVIDPPVFDYYKNYLFPKSHLWPGEEKDLWFSRENYRKTFGAKADQAKRIQELKSDNSTGV